MASTDLALYRRLWREARPYWPHLAGMFLLSLLATPIALLVPLPMKIIVDSVLGSHPLPRLVDVVLPLALHSKNALLALMVAFLLGIALVSQLKELGVSLLRTYTGENWSWASAHGCSATSSASRSRIMIPREAPTRRTGFSGMP